MKNDEKVELETEDIKDTMNDNSNAVLKFLESEEAKSFFPNQVIIYKLFQFPEIIIQTIREHDINEFEKNPQSKNLMIIEYRVFPNYISDPNYVGPSEMAESNKVIDPKNPFTLSIKSNLVDPDISLDDKLELEYLENFKIVFVKLIELIFDNLKEEDLEKLKNDKENNNAN